MFFFHFKNDIMINMEEQQLSMQELQQQLDAQQEALVKLYKSVEKTRKYIFWSGVMNILVFVIPLVIFLFALPTIMNSLNSSLEVLNGVTSASGSVPADFDLEASLQTLQELGL